MDLLPGLPDDVALDCLIRVPFERLPATATVCKGWKTQIELPEFHHRRRAAGLTQSVIVVAQAWVDPSRGLYGSKRMAPPFYRLAVCDLGTGCWADLPPVPDLLDGLPVLCQLAGVGPELVVIGGCDPVTWRVLDSVFIYNFVTGMWRRGADMPGGQRLFFGCASDSDRMVYVAGGHDEEKNALKSAMAYDVAEDKWVHLPDMAKARDECKGIFHGGRFHVIGGYPTEMQGRFGSDAEVFYVATWQWSPIEGDFLKDATCPANCASGGDGRMYMCHNGNVMARGGDTWQVLAGLPSEAYNVDYVTGTWEGKLVVIGCSKFDEPHKAYVMDDLKGGWGGYRWSKIEAAEEYTGHVQSGCYLEI